MRPFRSPRSLAFLVAGSAAGLVLLGVLAHEASPAAIMAALAAGGWPLVAAALYRLVPLSLNTLGWRSLLPPAGRPGWLTLLRLRWIGESVNALLPVGQVGGDFARARLLAETGMSGAEATAAMIADVAVGAATQVVFTLMGLGALMLGVHSGAHLGGRAGSIALAVALAAASAAALVVLARVGVSRIVAALPMRVKTSGFATRLTAGAASVDRALADLRRRHAALGRSAGWHLAGWIAQAGETWLVMRMLGHPVGLAAALAIESLAASARGAAFAVPGGLGVQEGALVLAAAPFGIDMPTALALGIIKRGRELLVGAPAIVAWAIAERRFLDRLLKGAAKKAPGRPTSTNVSTTTSRSRTVKDLPLRVAALVDLRWTPSAGGHVKTWERLAAAAVALPGDLDLTVHFSGTKEDTHHLAPNVRYRIHKPVLSTAVLPFLSHIPDHTDLAPYHPRLAALLGEYDVIHTTDGTFSFAQTAARVARQRGIPLTSSVHTTTPFYTRVFTAATVERLAGRGRLARLLLDRLNVAGRAEAHVQRKLDAHLDACAFVLASRLDDRARLAALLGDHRVGLLRRGIDHRLFDPQRRDRAWLESALGVPRDRQLVISVGRLDRIKNILVLAQAVRQLADDGRPVHLLCAGKGADRAAVEALLGARVTCAGVLEAPALARAYASADVCAQPAVVEELSNAVLEAGASGLPVLVAASSGSGRLLADGHTGLVVRGDAVEDWAAALRGLLDDPARLRAMGEAARAWSLANAPTWTAVLREDLLPAWQRGARERGREGQRTKAA